mgnify:FL=1|tara:strand:+ start:54 stop:359 length:306 start_codon:yes stop_codon:yes gene_type:complete
MKIKLIKNETETIGWYLYAETMDEAYKINSVRNMIFFGYDDQVVKYNGRLSHESIGDPDIDPELILKDNEMAGALFWCMEKNRSDCSEFMSKLYETNKMKK